MVDLGAHIGAKYKIASSRAKTAPASGQSRLLPRMVKLAMLRTIFARPVLVVKEPM